MEQKLMCDTVRDLLPLYIDKLTSEVSNQSIKEHLEDCESCKTMLQNMNREVEADTVPEVRNFKQLLARSRWEFIFWTFGILSLIALVTCFIVNLATERRLSWFYIVAGSIVTACLPLFTGIYSNEHRVIRFFATLNLCAILLLGLIQIVLYFHMGVGSVWFWRTGLPISIIWSVVLWAAIGCHAFFKANFLTATAILLFFSIPGELLTNLIAGSMNDKAGITLHFFTNIIPISFSAVLFLIAGIIYRNRKKR